MRSELQQRLVRFSRNYDAMSRTLVIIGLIIVAVGLFWPWLSKLPLGRLPGDIVIERENFRVYFPITTMIIVSVVVSVVLWLFRK